ncbi:hypothetical protein [Corynebacterium sputi]|uniref:hypothetical protein n=1 Tax=Corynebacterium sputi TaxID=489915 RepID=UPI000418E066|nr:hypothetical protein [Corynebacterium sputi]
MVDGKSNPADPAGAHSGENPRRRPRRRRFSGRTDHATGLSEHPDSAGQTPTAAAAAGTSEPVETGGSPVATGVGQNHTSDIDVEPQDPAAVTEEDAHVDNLGLRHQRGLLVNQFLVAFERPRQVMSFMWTSPGRITLVAFILVIAILAAGLAVAGNTNNRQTALADLSAQSEPMANATQHLYSALSVADAAANTAFSLGLGTNDSELRSDYDDAIAQASIAGTRAAAGVNDVTGEQMQAITEVQRLVPLYTGLIETARTNSQQGNPVGVTYLIEASELMQSSILPAAAELYRLSSVQVAEERLIQTSLPWVPISGLFAAVLMLLGTQLWLTRRTRRLVNPGLASATVLMITALGAISIMPVTVWRGADSIRQAPPVELLTEARITAQQTRAAETLDLVNRRSDTGGEFNESTTRVDTLIAEAADTAGIVGDTRESLRDQAILDASSSLTQWRAAHNQMVDYRDAGNYDAATTIASGDGLRGYSSASAFSELDESLQIAIAESRADLRARIEDARAATAALSSIVVLISIVSTTCVAFGFRQPMLEYL